MAYKTRKKKVKKKKTKEAQKKQRETMIETKEFRLSVKIDVHDFETRVTNARKALEKGNKVKASIRFKGRQITHPELARDVLIKFYNELSDIADIELQPKLEGKYQDQITFVKDRPGHDLRYAIDATKIESELGWKADENFESGILKTVRWYLEKFNNK